jgi:DNA methylase
MSGAPRLRLAWKDTETLVTATHSQRPVEGLTHDFYRYPARFSPEFVRAVINVFSNPGELVADPFVGGGTTLVEARVLGRLGIGSDISSLATFVTNTKTQRLSAADIDYLTNWFLRLPDKLNLHRVSTAGKWKRMGYLRNLQCEVSWPIRKGVEIALREIRAIRILRRASFARCVLLRTAQWALDGRKEIPGIAQFRDRLLVIAESMLTGAREYARATRTADRLTTSEGRKRTVCLNGSAEELADYVLRGHQVLPKVIVFSPPYPGVHVLYHRWQVRSSRETPAPFWIANQLDGAGEAFYGMHARRENLELYFAGLRSAYSALSKIASRDTMLIQLVAFSDPASQLPRFLDMVHDVGFREYLLNDFVDSFDGRLWRNVPNRKWHATKKGRLASGKEVVLIHKPR